MSNERNGVFDNAAAVLSQLSAQLAAELDRLNNLAAYKKADEHTLNVTRGNLKGLSDEIEKAHADLAAARAKLDDTKAEATKIVADARAAAATIRSGAEADAKQIVATAKKKAAKALEALGAE